MCQIFEDLEKKRANERAEELREETRIETLFNSIKSLMKSMKWTAEQAMTAMNVSENDEMLLKTRFQVIQMGQKSFGNTIAAW